MLPAGVRAVGVDFERPASLSAPLQGVERLFLTQGSSPRARSPTRSRGSMPQWRPACAMW
ncbi:MAG: hypothetical protein VB138_00680 [Burkholderia sp.]